MHDFGVFIAAANYVTEEQVVVSLATLMECHGQLSLSFKMFSMTWQCAL